MAVPNPSPRALPIIRQYQVMCLSALMVMFLVLVEAGEMVGVDATVTAGEARIMPWLDAHAEVVRREGDPVVAGARVMASRLRLTTTWSGRDRAWMRLLSIPSTRIDVASPTPRALRLTIERGGAVVVDEATSVARMARGFDELTSWLAIDNVFPDGVVLLTGTGIVPPAGFSLQDGDVVRIAIDGIGVLVNPVTQHPRLQTPLT